MIPGFEISAVRLYFHSGWAIALDPSFEAEFIENGETLFMFNEKKTREVYLSSAKITVKDGKPSAADALLSAFSQVEFSGLRFEHEANGLVGRALWIRGEMDTESQPSWVLMTFMVSEAQSKMARCTVVCDNESDMEWALEKWRSIALLETPQAARPAKKKSPPKPRKRRR